MLVRYRGGQGMILCDAGIVYGVRFGREKYSAQCSSNRPIRLDQRGEGTIVAANKIFYGEGRV